MSITTIKKYLFFAILPLIYLLSCTRSVSKKDDQLSFEIKRSDFNLIYNIVKEKKTLDFNNYTIELVDNSFLRFNENNIVMFAVGEPKALGHVDNEASGKLILESLRKDRNDDRDRKFKEAWVALVEKYNVK